MKFNLEEKGLRTLLKDYKEEIMRYTIKRRKANSGQAYRHLQEVSIKISRASVIFFMNDMVDAGHLSYTEKSGKGGYHRVYHAEYPNMAEFIHVLREKVIAHANQELQEGI